MVRFSNIADLGLNFGPGIARAGLANEARQAREAAVKAQRLQDIDIEEAFEEVQSPLQATRQQGLLTIGRIQGPKAVQAVTQILDRGTEQQVEAARVEADKDLKRNVFLESAFKGKSLPERARILTDLAAQGDLNPEDMQDLIKLQNMDIDQQDTTVLRNVTSLTPATQLLKDRAAEQKFQREQATADQFENVLNTKGEIIAQRNTVTGEVKESPLAAGGTGGSDRFSKSPPVIVNNEDGTQSLVTQILDKQTGETTIESDVIGGKLVSRLGETPEQQTIRKIEQAGGSESAKREAQIDTAAALAIENVRAKAHEERVQDNINVGISSAKLIPSIKRNLDLLKLVQTGGFAAAKLKAKQILGTESANEAELANALKKSVLSQLKETFGAQFTEREGALLADIEAGFGKSTAGNVRLMRRAQVIMEDRVKRGIRAARKAGDEDAIRDINEIRGVNLDVDAPVNIRNIPPQGEEDSVFTGNKTPEGLNIFQRPDGSTFAFQP